MHGDCLAIMPQLAARSVDFILTDPPYIAFYRSRDNQTLHNDDNAEWLAPSFAEVYRVLKNDACAISFYGWPKVDLFFAAWKQAGFRIAGHIVFRKRYASKTAFLQYRHEAAYLLVKGNPAFPAAPLPGPRTAQTFPLTTIALWIPTTLAIWVAFRKKSSWWELAS
jgi:site-specific DNA-methyltransferase (adenine-specific)